MVQAKPDDQPQPPHSHHIFLFPFKWDVLEPERRFDEQAFDARCHLPAFEEKLTKGAFDLTGDLAPGSTNAIKLRWHRCNYNFGPPDKAPANYSEYTYFYDFVRHSLYDTHGANQEPVQYYELGLVGPGTEQTVPVPTYKQATLSFGRLRKDKIDPETKKEKEVFKTDPFILKLLSISMHVFNTGVGVLSFFTENHTYDKEADILLINQLGRRIYPEFLETYVPTGKEDPATMNGLEPLLINTQLANMLATQVTVAFGEEKAIFSYQEYTNTDLLSLREQAKKLPRRVRCFFPDEGFFDYSDRVTQASDRIAPAGVLLRNIMDDRMFTLCWFGNNASSQRLKGFNEATNQYHYESDNFWFAFISGDANAVWPTVQHRQLLKDYIEQFTYKRWANFGTLYGVTRELLVVLSEDIPSLRKVGAPALNDHIQQMYYQIAVLCLVQRASVLRFTGEITLLTERMITKDAQSSSDLADRVSVLYRHYIDFLNRLYFREITPQIQGDEIYGQLQAQMETKEEVESAGRQLQELNNYVAAKRADNEAKSSRQFGDVINLLVPVSILGGILSFIGIDRMIVFGSCFNPGFITGLAVYLVLAWFAITRSKIIINWLSKRINDKR